MVTELAALNGKEKERQKERREGDETYRQTWEVVWRRESQTAPLRRRKDRRTLQDSVEERHGAAESQSFR